ncbi:MAG: response regulator [Candidatus Staskawiczbacteria bacterium]|nr:response regulator [Candidatus Staskawiczbacteria bacterium]
MGKKSGKGKILIVEDDEDTRDIYCKALTLSGFQTVCAINGKEGLEKAISEMPNLILLDVLMPIMDGFSMLKELRKEAGPAKEIPVVMLTNLSADSEDIIKKVAETGPVYYMVKANLSVKQLADKVKEFLGQK